MPTEKRRKGSTPEDVPHVGDPERKRVLNVLAQRRYRQRRRERLAALEAQVRSSSVSTEHKQAPGGGVRLDSDGQSGSTSDSNSEESGTVDEVAQESVDLSSAMMDFGQDPIDYSLFQDFNLEPLPNLPPSTSSTSPPRLLSPSQTYPTNLPFTFPLSPDGALMTVPMLSTLRAFGTIATCLDLLNHIWDPFYLHTLAPNPSLPLPLNLHPTPIQSTIPHHPLLDTLPWPSIRDKLICIFNMPSFMRPPIARETEGNGQAGAIAKIVDSLDDSRDGCRVHGNAVGWEEGNELVEEAWEVGERFYRDWWWCMDAKVVELSNRRRLERGERALRLVGTGD